MHVDEDTSTGTPDTKVRGHSVLCRSACVDSYRALVLRTEWEKPYYRCAESWLSLGNLSIALSVNVAGCDSCSMNTDLLRQRSEILAAMKAQGR